MPIRDLPSHQRPREKALTLGLKNLTDIELLALFIRVGGKGSVLSVAFKLMSKFKSLHNIGNADISELSSIKGIGKVKALELKALFEYHSRVTYEQEHVQTITKVQDVINIALKQIDNFLNEHFIIIILDNSNKILSIKTMYRGTKHSVQVEPREVAGEALKGGAHKIYCFHNHPSDDIIPSQADILVTKRLNNYLDIFDIKLAGHYVINKNSEYLKIEI